MSQSKERLRGKYGRYWYRRVHDTKAVEMASFTLFSEILTLILFSLFVSRWYETYFDTPKSTKSPCININ
jgi:hypothetical protein